MALFSQAGTLAGVDVAVAPFGGTGTASTYTEVHNLHLANTYTVAVGAATIRLPPMRKVVLTEPVNSFVLNGTGDYIVLAGNTAQPNQQGPKIEPTIYYAGTIAPTISPADGVTLEDTGIVTRIKDLGVSTAKIANLAVTTGKLADGSVTYDKVLTGAQALVGIPDGANLAFTGNPAPGNTVRIQYGASDVTYTFVAVPAAPTDVLIGGTAADTCDNLAADIAANQPLVNAQSFTAATQPVCGLAPVDPNMIGQGDQFTITVVGAPISEFALSGTSAELKTGCIGQSFTVDAVLTAADAVFVPFAMSILTWVVHVRDATGTCKYWTGGSALAMGSTGVLLIDGGATPWAVNDTFTIMAFGQS